MPVPTTQRLRRSRAQRSFVQVFVGLHLAAAGLALFGVLSLSEVLAILLALYAGVLLVIVVVAEQKWRDRPELSPDVVDGADALALPPRRPPEEDPVREGRVLEADHAQEQKARVRRRGIAAGVALALLVQVLIPLRYYFGDDEYDERFSWRMFSAVRIQQCDIRASETRSGRTEPVRLMATVQAGWVTILRRNREAAMERYLEWRCEQPGVTRARLENQCRTPEGERLPTIVREIDCASGRIVREGGRE